MTRIDEDQEVIAAIRMAINTSSEPTPPLDADCEDDAECGARAHHGEHDNDESTESAHSHWGFGSPLRMTNSRAIENEMKHSPLFIQFHTRLWKFLASHYPEEALHEGLSIKVCP
jgi:hypothetical protein